MLGILVTVWRRKFRLLIVAVLLFCVLAIVISPFVDLPASALRARAAAILCFLALLGAAFMLDVIAEIPFALTPAKSPDCAMARPPEVICTWLC